MDEMAELRAKAQAYDEAAALARQAVDNGDEPGIDPLAMADLFATLLGPLAEAP